MPAQIRFQSHTRAAAAIVASTSRFKIHGLELPLDVTLPSRIGRIALKAKALVPRGSKFMIRGKGPCSHTWAAARAFNPILGQPNPFTP